MLDAGYGGASQGSLLSWACAAGVVQCNSFLTDISVIALCPTRSDRYRSSLQAAFMSLEAARNLSVLDLLHVLNEKLGLECDKMRETVPPAMSSSLLEKEVSEL